MLFYPLELINRKIKKRKLKKQKMKYGISKIEKMKNQKLEFHIFQKGELKNEKSKSDKEYVNFLQDNLYDENVYSYWNIKK